MNSRVVKAKSRVGKELEGGEGKSRVLKAKSRVVKAKSRMVKAKSRVVKAFGVGDRIRGW